MILAIIIFIFVLGLLVFVHESGHFIAAKKGGIKVEEFAFGFPPRLFAFRVQRIRRLKELDTHEEIKFEIDDMKSGANEKIKETITEEIDTSKKSRTIWNWKFAWGPKSVSKLLESGLKNNQTIYGINAIPLGGYVKLFGEEGTHLKDPKSFYGKPLGSRFFVIVAGVLMNLILGWILFSVGYSIGLPVTATNPSTIPNAKITTDIIVSDALPNTPAKSVGISKGDIITGANSTTFATADNMTKFTKANMGKSIILDVKSYGSVKKIPVTLSKNSDAPLGVSILESQKIKVPFWQAPWTGLKEVWNIIVAIFVALGSFFGTLFKTGHASGTGVVGPVGIWFIFQTATKLGFSYILQLTALISINLGIINILPFPALDGGRLIFWLIELIRRKRITPRIEGIVHSIGFALLIILILVITFRDIMSIR
jgi:regulator of sigma E protease